MNTLREILVNKNKSCNIASNMKHFTFFLNKISYFLCLKLTNLKNLKFNSLVNVELDIFSKYIYKYSN